MVLGLMVVGLMEVGMGQMDTVLTVSRSELYK